MLNTLNGRMTVEIEFDMGVAHDRSVSWNKAINGGGGY